MKKTMLFSVIAVMLFPMLANAGNKPVPEKPAHYKIFTGYQSVTSSNGNSVTVYVDWNTTNPLFQRVSAVSVIDNNGITTYTVTSWEQYPRMNLVSGVLTASGWRCDFTYGGGATDYVVLNGNLTML